MRDRHLAALEETSETTVDSPFIRFLVYKVLDERGTPHTSETFGYGSGKNLAFEIAPCSSSYAKIAMSLLMRGRFRKEHVLNAIDVPTYLENQHVSLEEVASLFAEEVTRDEKFAILTRLFHDNWLRWYMPASAFTAYKLIKKIRV